MERENKEIISWHNKILLPKKRYISVSHKLNKYCKVKKQLPNKN